MAKENGKIQNTTNIYFFSAFKMVTSITTHLDQKQQINNTINSNPSTSNKSEAARVRKRYI